MLGIIAIIAIALVTAFYWHYAPEYDVVSKEDLSECTQIPAGLPPGEVWAVLERENNERPSTEKTIKLISECEGTDYSTCSLSLGLDEVLPSDSTPPERHETVRFHNEALNAAIENLTTGKREKTALLFLTSLQNLTVLQRLPDQSNTMQLQNLFSIVFALLGTDQCDNSDETCLRLSVLLAEYLYRTERYSEAKQIMNFASTSTQSGKFSSEKILDQYYLDEEKFGQEPMALIQALFNAAVEKQKAGNYAYAGAYLARLGAHIQENYWQWASKTPDTPDQCVINTMRYSLFHSDRLLSLALQEPTDLSLIDRFFIYSIRASARRRAPDG